MVGYVRVSTPKQIEGNSLQVQKDSIKKYCELHKHDLVEIYQDAGISAFKHRPEFEKAIKCLFEDPTIQGFIVHTLSRFGRSTLDLLTKITEINELGKTFISIKQSIDLSTKEGKLLFVVLSGIAEYETEIIKERLEAGRAYADKYGTKSGKPSHRPEIIINWPVVKRLRERKLSWTAIARYLNISPTTLIKHAKNRGLYL